MAECSRRTLGVAEQLLVGVHKASERLPRRAHREEKAYHWCLASRESETRQQRNSASDNLIKSFEPPPQPCVLTSCSGQCKHFDARRAEFLKKWANENQAQNSLQQCVLFTMFAGRGGVRDKNEQRSGPLHLARCPELPGQRRDTT